MSPSERLQNTPPFADATTTVAELRAAMARFVEEREWTRFHRPKHLAMSVAIEAAELMEHFQWTDAGASPAEQGDQSARVAVGEEMADVLAYLVSLANALEIDLAAAFERKMARNREKYPAEEFRGRATRERRDG
jgi:dCTP diphosphatase